jgi:hypothetical protein
MIDFWIGALASFVSSFALIFGLFIFAKPKFVISDKIAYLHSEDYGKDLQGSYLIKVQNKSLFVTYDLQANIEYLKIYYVSDGTNDRSFDIELVDSTTNYLSGKHIFKNTGKSCFLFRTTEDLQTILSQSGTKLRFTLMARNGFSGLTKMFIKEYNTRDKIKNGHFGFGKNFEIQ